MPGFVGRKLVPPSIPNDYQLYPGVGYYKYHSNTLTFDEANKKCAEEGGHLAIINSEAEHQVIKSLVTKGTAYLGFHDQIKEGEFITIFGEPLAATGFTRWAPNQPDDAGGKEDCGTYWAGQGLNDIPCSIANFFVCEYDLAWAE
ncbi:hypothetical protein J437_LFUL000194 [Ladona fulva]|uniref:C-type lectin domain-containing protein n=1 Tax=Ladona fulva TaxID=123851 RepID=A0A8K0KBR2_LADFU|nr:hypothetical protein J437_LFUL000194 [Ladona fulva]